MSRSKIRGMVWETTRELSAHEIIDLVLVSELIQASKREPNPAAINHYLRALADVRKLVADQKDAATFRRLKSEVQHAYLLPLTRFYRWIDAVITNREEVSS